ncbi:MAG: sigma-70 family RNA polymerase sigma factor [Alphaproteobacteria bacterium]|nr:sigma-70 family RNA polymerase sigma factor [Alphaproteobacteria bacterium]
MSAVSRGDVRAFGCMVERYRGSVMRLAFNVLRDAGDAEDVVQEVFERVWIRASAWHPRREASFFAWLIRIALNLAIDRVRRPRQLQFGDSYDAPAATPDAEQCLLAKEIGRRIAAAFARLPERQRVAFALCQIERMRNAAAAECLGVSVGALELLLVRARKTMRRELADLLEGDR